MAGQCFRSSRSDVHSIFECQSINSRERGSNTSAVCNKGNLFVLFFSVSKAGQQFSFRSSFRSFWNILMILVSQKRTFGRFTWRLHIFSLDLSDPQTNLISILKFTFKIFSKEISTYSFSVTSRGFNLIH